MKQHGGTRLCLLAASAFMMPLCRPLAAAPLRAELRAATIGIGERAFLSGQAAAGGRVSVQITGPAPIAAGSATAGPGGAFALELGPFAVPGSYGLYVRCGIEQQLLVLEVRERMAGAELAEAARQYIQAMNRMKTAMQNSVDKLAARLGAFPAGDPDLGTAAREIPRLRTLFFEVYRITEQVVGLTEPMVFSLSEIEGVRPEARDGVGRFFRDGADILNPASEALENDGRDDGAANAQDWCTRVESIKKGLHLLASALKIYVGGYQHYIIETLAAGRGAGAVGWFQEHFMERLPSAWRPSNSAQEHNVHRVHTGIEMAMPYVLEGEHAHPWASLISLCESQISGRLDHYLEEHCVTFRGRISGHVHVEALENGNAFYAQDNDWTGQATLTGAKQTGDGPVRLAGSIIGRAKNFKAENRLYVIYGRNVEQKVFLTLPPLPHREAAALFYAKIEATLQAGTLTLRYLSTGFEGVRHVEAYLVAVVVPFGSPVPVVHKLNLPFQGAAFQLSRCFGKEGVGFPVEMEIVGPDSRRRVRGARSHDLANAGARGTFKIKVDLCSNCPESWEGEE